MDNLRYQLYQEKQFRRFEDACRRCGECCGSRDGDSCVNLAEEELTGKYYCRVYENRLGPQKTAGGRIFNCVYIDDVMKLGCLRANCSYNTITNKGNAVESKTLEWTKSPYR